MRESYEEEICVILQSGGGGEGSNGKEEDGGDGEIKENVERIERWVVEWMKNLEEENKEEIESKAT